MDGWMQSEVVFEEFIRNVFYPYFKDRQIQLPVVLFIDGPQTHLTYLSQLCEELKIAVVALFSAILQEFCNQLTIVKERKIENFKNMKDDKDDTSTDFFVLFKLWRHYQKPPVKPHEGDNKNENADDSNGRKDAVPRNVVHEVSENSGDKDFIESNMERGVNESNVEQDVDANKCHVEKEDNIVRNELRISVIGFLFERNVERIPFVLTSSGKKFMTRMKKKEDALGEKEKRKADR
ncbi:hypothetical protein PR048_031848 [Dryococelus australis]|uniref:DDE-1 domain-containing protein n=1 Tax=Dryococelus australis TaxID=614101 RepID=A0ABQ9G6E9_9NEOP|nr:hypothetical protein PR048_031848 [Dryococelus australis]